MHLSVSASVTLSWDSYKAVFTIKAPSSDYANIFWHNDKYVVFADVANQINSSAAKVITASLSDSGNTLNLKFNEGNALLVYSTDTNTLRAVRTSDKLCPDDIIAFHYRFGNEIIGGDLWQLYLNRKTEQGGQISEYNWYPKTAEFSALLNDTQEVDTFMFFSDPHCDGSGKRFSDNVDKILDEVEVVYNHAPVSACICGGDWLNTYDTKTQACYKLGVVDAAARKRFPVWINAVGNHDTNTLGHEELGKPDLSQSTINNLLFRTEKRAYYKKQLPTAIVYVFDTGTEEAWWDEKLTPYRKEQCLWFAQSLLEDDPAHSFCMMHIITEWASEQHQITAMTRQLAYLIDAYNHRKTAYLFGQSWDYSKSKGTCHFMIGGHDHADYTTTVTGVPVVLIEATTLADNDVPSVGKTHPTTFDLCLADYTNHVLHCVRCGYGNNRDIQIIPTVVNPV